MKKIIIIILLSIALNGEIFADDKVGIPSENVQAKSKDSDNLGTIKAEFSERFLTTSVIIGEVVLLLFILFFWKGTKNDSDADDNTIFKKNIKALRNERLIPIINQKKSKKRVKLLNKLNFNRVSGKFITSKAKKLSISKGELFLAARIQQLSNQVR